MKGEKAGFMSRICAFFLDMLIVSLIASLLATPFVSKEKMESLNEDYEKIVEKIQTQELNLHEYTVEVANLRYEVIRVNGMGTIINILIGMFWFVLMPLYLGGQTLGKKILKIKMISDKDDLTANQLLVRSMIGNSFLFDLLGILEVLLFPKYIFYYCHWLLLFVPYILMFVSVIMVLVSKDGRAIHDYLGHTKVVKIKEMKI